SRIEVQPAARGSVQVRPPGGAVVPSTKDRVAAPLGFLHTAAVHVATFDALLAETAPETRAIHRVDEALLARARAAGADAPDAVRDVERAMHEVHDAGAPVVVCTCSTIDGAAEATPTSGRFLAQRIDRRMADLATAADGAVLLVAALASTVEPTR